MWTRDCLSSSHITKPTFTRRVLERDVGKQGSFRAFTQRDAPTARLPATDQKCTNGPSVAGEIPLGPPARVSHQELLPRSPGTSSCAGVRGAHAAAGAHGCVCTGTVTSATCLQGNGEGRLTDRTTSLIRMMGVLRADPDGRIQRLYSSSKNWEQEWISTPARCFLQSRPEGQSPHTQDERLIPRGTQTNQITERRVQNA